MKAPFLSLSLAEARAAVAECGGGAVHADRIRRRLLRGRDPLAETEAGFALPKELGARLAERFDWLTLTSATVAAAPDGAEKHLLRLHDGETVEAVRLPGTDAPSACISSQVGCGIGCRFCASGLLGVRRNLAGHEILEQVALLRRHGPVKRLVFMGAGEPTHNIPALQFALPVLRDEAELGLRATLVSTVGPPSAIDRLRELGLRFTLAVSLHTLDPALRADLIPTQSQVDPFELLAAADRYFEVTRRPYQVEVALLSGLNDSPEAAAAMAEALQGRRAHVSVIPWNPVEGMPFATPAPEAVSTYVDALRAADISCTLRNTVGGDAFAACGQLRASVSSPS